MKFSLVAITGVLMGSLHVAAFPFLSGDMSKMIEDLATKLNALPSGQLENLWGEIQKGIQQVTDMSNGTIPDTSGLANLPFKGLTPEAIYQAIGVNRQDPNVASRGLGANLWPVGEDANHPFIPPGPGDQRGPCPGLNTIANHGYLPRSGIVNPVELFIGTWNGLSLSPDLCAILAVISFVFKGDLTTLSLSIGGQHGLGGGLSNHGVLEGDASVTRNDAWTGNGWAAVPSRVEDFKAIVAQNGGNVNPVALAQARYKVWDWSRHNNPQFDFNPWRMIVAYGESGFVMEALRGENPVFSVEDIDYWFIKQRYPPGWRRRTVPITTPEILAWAALIEVLKPTLPGWTLGIPGAFIPLPAFGDLGSFFGRMNGGDTIKSIGCAVGGSVVSWFPNMLTGIVGKIGLGNAPGALQC